MIPPGVYDSLDNPRGGAIRAVKNGKIGLLDSDGNIVVAFAAYDRIVEPADGSVFVAESGGKTLLIDSRGKQIAAVSQDGDVGRFVDGFATIERDGHVGYIDASGETIIPLQFDEASGFRNDLALVTQGKTKGYIDRTGDFVWKTDRWK